MGKGASAADCRAPCAGGRGVPGDEWLVFTEGRCTEATWAEGHQGPSGWCGAMADRTEGWTIDRRLVALVAAGRGGGSHGDERGHISKEENGGEEKGKGFAAV
jgi:hypothetical protein